MSSVIGWDIGGAHVKAALAREGRLVSVTQRACAPHEGLATLERAIREALDELGAAERHRVTMTAELSDAFEDRARGVLSVAAIVAREIGGADTRFYAGPRGLVVREELAGVVESVASANWRVSAQFVAQHCAEALFIDIGSTTTDLIPIRDGCVAALGESDSDRLARGELAYAGLSRGAPQAYAMRAPVDGCWTPLVNEGFATMADIRRLTGDLPEGECAADLAPTADGRPKTIEASRARLARLVGRDAAQLDRARAVALAQFLSLAQLRVIEDQIALILSRGAVAPGAPFVAAGVGRALVARLTQARGRVCRDFSSFIDAPEVLRAKAADCAPAAALALLDDAKALR